MHFVFLYFVSLKQFERQRFLKLKVYEVILPVLCGCEMWLLILSEEHKLQVFGNKILTKMFSHERGKGSSQYNVIGRPSFIQIC
jgi:hypothetical protein